MEGSDAVTFSDSKLGADLPEAPAAEPTPYEVAEQMFCLLMTDLCDGVDHPEIWNAFPEFMAKLPALGAVLEAYGHLGSAPRHDVRVAFTILTAMAIATLGHVQQGLACVEDLGTRFSESPLVQGAIFHLNRLLDPENPKYDLSQKFCQKPFDEIHVLENGSHLCCASWLNLSVGDLSRADSWEQVWNSHNAERIRASIHDGSYRHCNKTACPSIQANTLPTREKAAASSDRWKAIIETLETNLPAGPQRVNLAYDRTCNLSCPSCRNEKFAADSAMRERFDRLQERAILPMLKGARTVFITGSGDPFASKNFRQLMSQLTEEEYPDLRFIVMTNAMLFNRREWDRFPALHRRVESLQISIDAATGPTHELLRRGARWEVMQENMQFAAELLAQGLVSQFHLSFTVQVENYREMGDAADLARALKATSIYFGRVTNWGTFSAEEYARKAVFQPGHPEHAEFLEAMRDPRLRGPGIQIGNLIDFLPEAEAA